MTFQDQEKSIVWDPSKKCQQFPFPITSQNSRFISLNFISQNGPQCGFAALCMIASVIGVKLDPDALVAQARALKFTNHGEMFSTLNMIQYAETILKPYFEITLNFIGADLRYFIKSSLNEKSLILIPYDCDSNHEPCMKNGSKAHWAIICGYIDGGSEENFYVLACHSKSQYASAWKLNDLKSSNINLHDLGYERKKDNREFILPIGGLKEGLSSKFIVFKRKT